MEPRVSAVEEDIEDMGTDEEEELMEVKIKFKKFETRITSSILKQDPNNKFNHLSFVVLCCYFSFFVCVFGGGICLHFLLFVLWLGFF